MTTDPCDLCSRPPPSPIYDLTRTCCRVRLILSMPKRETRRAWLARWRAEDADRAQEIENKVKAAWSR